MRTTLSTLLTLALLANAGFGAAQAAPKAPAPSPSASAAPHAEMAEGNESGTPDAVTHHTMILNGKPLAYTARAGTIVLRDRQEHPTASMFYTAFTLDDVDATTRPVTFIYNGGPGSASLWLRMGSFGPVRVDVPDGTPAGPPPYRIVENQQTLLDRSDLVFIDMPDSGFSRIMGVGKPADFFGADQDVRAFQQFIERYITTYRRWNSPKFLFGESYGTPRSAALVDALQNDGVSVNGVILLSSILNYGLYARSYPPYRTIGGSDWVYPLYLPTEAAVAWVHHRVSNPPASLDTFAKEVQDFAMGEYLQALAQGAKLAPAEYNRIVATLHRYTGLSEQYIRQSNLRVPYQRFQAELLRGESQMVGRYDGRYVDYTLDGEQQETPFDATDSAIDGAFISANNQYVRETLQYTTTLPYRTFAGNRGWDFKHNGTTPLNTAPDLAEAMTFNPNLRVFSANGYYDFATPFLNTVYVLNHLNLAPPLQSHISYGFYESGHMVYLHPQARQQMHDDLERWYDATLSGQ